MAAVQFSSVYVPEYESFKLILPLGDGHAGAPFTNGV